MSKKIMISKSQLEMDLKNNLSMDEMAKKYKCYNGTILKRFKEYNLKFLGASYFNKGDKNPSKRIEVQNKIKNNVKELWDLGVYKNRINGMQGKIKWLNPNYKGHKWDYKEYLSQFQDIERCKCSRISKINIHHIDEDHNNWLVTNMVPICNLCHKYYHFKIYKTPFITIVKEFTIEYGHHLLNYVGMCSEQHGHSGHLKVYIRQRLNKKTGMVMDYKDLKEVVNEYVIKILDHHNINEIIKQPTAENMLIWIWQQLEFKALLKGMIRLEFKETENSTAILTNKDMLEYYSNTEKKSYCEVGDFD